MSNPFVVSMSNPHVVSMSNPLVVSMSNPLVVSMSNPLVVSMSNPLVVSMSNPFGGPWSVVSSHSFVILILSNTNFGEIQLTVYIFTEYFFYRIPIFTGYVRPKTFQRIRRSHRQGICRSTSLCHDHRM